MKKACEDFNTKKKERYGKDMIFATSRIYNKAENKIGVCVHHYHDFDYDYIDINYMEFKYCPFCGTKIDGYVLKDD